MESDEKNMAQINSNSQNPKMQDLDKQNQIIYVNHSFVFPVGYRFCPRDDELIVDYLKKRIRNEVLPHDKIKDVNLYKHSPQELAENYPELGEKEWYFFTPRNRKYPNGHRPNRAAGRGFWKATGADKPIMHNNVQVGFRKALVFYEGKPPKGNKTNWIMHEYRVDESRRIKTHASDMKLDDWVLCMIYKRYNKSKATQNEEHEQEDDKFRATQNEEHEQEDGKFKGTQKEEHEQEEASKINSLENWDYEGTMDSCLEFARQQFELPYQYLPSSFGNMSSGYNGLYQESGNMSLGYTGLYQESNNIPSNIFPMNADFNNLYQEDPFNNLYQDAYYNIGMIESHNVLDIDALDENSPDL